MHGWLIFSPTLPLAGYWGGGEVASADGMRFVTPVKTVNSGPNRKYFGSGRGYQPGTTSSPISTPVSMALSFPVRFVIPSLYWKGFWSSRPG
ncbi:Tn3 family transposase [Acinetobacter baumannii]|uniref:Tn3 family transposase n=1 Tax=Acinetobacter baumannii TaxID=470 RepID=UPI003D1D2D2F